MYRLAYERTLMHYIFLLQATKAELVGGDCGGVVVSPAAAAAAAAASPGNPQHRVTIVVGGDGSSRTVRNGNGTSVVTDL